MELNYQYLTMRTNYLSKSELRRVFAQHFSAVIFAEKALLRHTYGGARRLGPLAQRVPLVASLYSSFYSRVIFAQK